MSDSAAQPNNRILIVDDNPAIHEDFKKILCPSAPGREDLTGLKASIFGEAPARANGGEYELSFAFQGREALQKVKESLAAGQEPALAFLDVRMPPGWDGIETAGHLWEVCPHLQIVICTAYSDYSWDEMKRRLNKPDSLVILKKPFDNVEVQQLAQALTRKWQLTRLAEMKMFELERLVSERTRELKLTNESLALTGERFSKAFHGSPGPCAIQDLEDLRFVDVNQRLLDIVGCQRDEIVGRTPAEMFFWENPAQADKWVEDLMLDKPVRDQAARIRTKSGAWHEVLVSLSAVALEKQTHILLLAQDMAERVLLESQLRQAQKMEAVGQLAAGVAHDFNNILTVIQGHSGLMRRNLPADSSLSPSLDQICKATDRAASLIQRLLMFSRKQVMQFKNLDLNATLSGTIRMLERLVGEQIQIKFTPHHPLPALRADSSMIEQIAMNLAVNARDAMPHGGAVNIRTSLESVRRRAIAMDPEPRDGDFVCLTFEDTGHGMDNQVLGRIFEPFFTTKPVGKGTGLGLSTVFGIVRAHQGWIVVTSAPNQGTTFKLYFPPSAEAAEAARPETEPMLLRGHETVLVAEDEESLRQMVAQVLRIQGYTVLEAASGVDALEVWERRERPVDLLVTDMVMPGGITGNELAARLRKQAPELKVIYTSGYSPGMAGQDVSLLEGRNFLPKPYSIGRLAQFVRHCLDEGSSEPPGNAAKAS